MGNTEDNIIFQENHRQIIEAYNELFEETGEQPSYEAVGEKVGLHRNTVYNHLKRIRFDKDIRPLYQAKVFSILKRHLELIDQTADPSVSVRAIAEYYKSVIGIADKKEIEIDDKSEAKTLKVEFVSKKKAEEEKETTEDQLGE